MTTEPTDDELAKLFTEETGFAVDDFPAAILDFARAALARRGQPSGAGEPVAWRYRMKGDLQWQYTERPEQFTHADEVQELTTPQPTQAVPPAGRDMLTNEQIDAEVFARWGDMKGAPLAMCRGFARAIEAEVRKDALEEAAKVCDRGAEQMLHAYKREGAGRCAAAIRALKEAPPTA